MSAPKAYIAGAVVKIRYFCSYKPLGRKGEPLNDFIITEVPISDLYPDNDP